MLPDLLDGLDLRACLVSLDALACRPAIAEQITARGGDYLLALKGNQKKAHAEVKRWFEANAFSLGGSLRPCFDAFDESHGRLVRRRVFACTELEPLAALQRWPGLTTVLAVENIRGINGSDKVTAEIRYYLSSSKLPATQLATPSAAIGRSRTDFTGCSTSVSMKLDSKAVEAGCASAPPPGTWPCSARSRSTSRAPTRH